MILFGLFFLVFGLVFGFFAGRRAVSEIKTYRWQEVSCRITKCEIKAEPKRESNPFSLDLSYRYSIHGKRYHSDRYTLQEYWEGDYEKLALIRKELTNNPKLVCYVDPDDPAASLLKREGLLAGLMMLGSLINVLIGSGIVWGGSWILRSKMTTQEDRTKAILRFKTLIPSRRRVMLVFGWIFTLVGLGLGIPLGIIPAKIMLESKNWVETPCTVIWSRVLRHEETIHDNRRNGGTKSVTWSVDIFYEYEFEGEKHRSNRYAGFKASSSGRSGKIAITKKYPPNSQRVCFVDPDLPERAMLKPGFSWMVVFGLIPLVFSAVGVAILSRAFGRRSNQ